MSAETMVSTMALGIVKATELIQELERERDSALAEVARLRGELEHATDGLRIMRDEYRKTFARAKDAEREVERLRAALVTMTQDRDALERELEWPRLRPLVRELNNTVSGLDKANTELRAEVEQLRAELVKAERLCVKQYNGPLTVAEALSVEAMRGRVGR
jgi:chromosome segregation ATPase